MIGLEWAFLIYWWVWFGWCLARFHGMIHSWGRLSRIVAHPQVSSNPLWPCTVIGESSILLTGFHFSGGNKQRLAAINNQHPKARTWMEMRDQYKWPKFQHKPPTFAIFEVGNTKRSNHDFSLWLQRVPCFTGIFTINFLLSNVKTLLFNPRVMVFVRHGHRYNW